jgi:hypothetical protein
MVSIGEIDSDQLRRYVVRIDGPGLEILGSGDNPARQILRWRLPVPTLDSWVMTGF